MSNLQNTEILENLFEDVKESLIKKGMHLIFSNEEIEECASKIAKSKFVRRTTRTIRQQLTLLSVPGTSYIFP